MSKSILNVLTVLFVLPLISIAEPSSAAEIEPEILCKITLLGKDPASVKRALDILDQVYGMLWLERDSDPKKQASPTRSKIFSVQEGWAPVSTLLGFDWRNTRLDSASKKANINWNESRLNYRVEPEVQSGLFEARYLLEELLGLVLNLSDDRGVRLRRFLTTYNGGTSFIELVKAMYSQKDFSKDFSASLLLGWIAPSASE